MASEKYEQGLKVRREVLGDEYVDRATANATDFNRDFQEYVTEAAWGSSWARGILTRQQRSLNVLCMTAALNRPNEFELHFRGALRNGVPLDDLRETLLQIAVYCGAPAGVEAFRIAGRVLEDEGVS
jgi:4-carboxymuconolactone decarboxylase